MPIEFEVPIIKEKFEEQFNKKHGPCDPFKVTIQEQINPSGILPSAQGQPGTQGPPGTQGQQLTPGQPVAEEKKEAQVAQVPPAEEKQVAQVPPAEEKQVAQVPPAEEKQVAQVAQKPLGQEGGHSGGRIHRSRRLLHQRGSE